MSEIIDLVQAIENKKQELADAEFKAEYLPRIINNLEMELFKKLQETAEESICPTIK